MQLELTNHVVIITGGASGIGRAIAELFISEGCKAALGDLSPSVADVACEPGSSTNAPAPGCVVDVTQRETIEAGSQAAEPQLGPAEHIVHAAAWTAASRCTGEAARAKGVSLNGRSATASVN
ncbi:MAG: SDR family NAD(P)-dependent oxidoreductase [Verrucomicrobia bacterium]|nr:SDR family NAD(P)-dependent oxidoreductase [Verrucomicrobiota bacterium]